MPTDYQQAFDCAGALQSAGLYDQAAGAFLEAMRLADGDRDARIRAALKAAACAFRAGQIPQAQGLWRTVAEDDAAPVTARVEAAGNLAVIEQHHGDIDAARRAAEGALSLAERHGMAPTVARQHGNLGLIALQTGDLGGAHHHLLAAAQGFGEVKDPRGQAQAWSALGEVALRQGRPDIASQRFHDAFELLRHLGAFREAAIPAANLAHLLRRLGRSRDALAMYGEVQAVLSREGDEGAGAWRDLAAVHLDLGDHAEAGRCLDRAEAAAATEAARAQLRLDRAGWHLADGGLSAAQVEVRAAWEALERLRDVRGSACGALMARRVEWRLGGSPEPLPDFVVESGLPEIAAAVVWEEAERAFEIGELDRARDTAAALVDRFQSLGEPQRAAAAWGLVQLTSLMDGRCDRLAVAVELDRTLQTLAAHGDVRTALAVGLEPALFLAILGEADGARILMRTLALHRTDAWPAAWCRGLDQLAALLALPEPPPQRAEASEDLATRLLEQAVEALAAGDRAAWRRTLAELRRHQRLTLAAVLTAVSDRLGEGDGGDGAGTPVA